VARFPPFPPNPVTALRHFGAFPAAQLWTRLSHNPAGAQVGQVVWLALASVIATEPLMAGGATPTPVARDTAAVASGDGSALGKRAMPPSDGRNLRHSAEEIHFMVANLLLLLGVMLVMGPLIDCRTLRLNRCAPFVPGNADCRP
jgi:cytochrome b